MIDGVESGLDQLSFTLNRVTAAYERIGLREEVSGAAFTSLSDQESPRFRGCVVCEIASEAIDAFGLPVGEDVVDAAPGPQIPASGRRDQRRSQGRRHNNPVQRKMIPRYPLPHPDRRRASQSPSNRSK